jgi:Terminase small subunit
MPALKNPRWERFAQCLVASLSDKPEGKNTFKAAYIAAGYSARGHSAEELASRLLRKVEPIGQRIRELQAEQQARLQAKLDLSKERVGRRLNLASEMAEQQQNPNAIVQSEAVIARVFGHITDKSETVIQQAKPPITSQDIAASLLGDVGLTSPDEDAKARALEAYDVLIATLERIRDDVLGLRPDRH